MGREILGVFFLVTRDECLISFTLSEQYTIGRVEQRALLRSFNEVTMLNFASILCYSKYVVDGCNGQAEKWRRSDLRTMSRPVMHTDLWKSMVHMSRCKIN